VLWESRRRYNTAKHRLKTGEVYKGKKELVHAVRYVLFATQIVEHGRITDFSAANPLLQV
jgi:hypothetical protein